MNLDLFLAKLTGVKKTSRGFMAYCPGHDDGGKCGRNGKEGQSLEVWEQDGSIGLKCYAGCNREAILSALDLTPGDLRQKPIRAAKPGAERQIERLYDYTTPDGQLLFQVVRYNPKGFAQRRPTGPGKFEYNLQGVTPVLYKLPELLAGIKDHQTVFVVEGEKDADNARGVGLTATTSPMGAGKWRKEYTDTLKDATRVVIIADKDKPGRSHAADIALLLKDQGNSVCVLEVPGEGKDFTDWVMAGGKVDDLLALAANTPDWLPPGITDEAGEGLRAKLKDISNDVYCIENGRICYKQITRELQENIIPLCNFTAHVTEQITRDDGLEANTFFHVLGRSCTGANLRNIEVAASDFAGLNWVVREWGMKAIIGAGMNAKDRLREAIQLISQDAGEKHIYTHTGWRHHDGKEIYLTQGGAIGADDVDVDLESQLKRYFLPQPDPTKTLEAVKKSLDFIYIAGDPHATIPLWAAMYLSPLADAVDLSFTLWLVGPSGCFKSTLTGLVLNHFGDFDQNHMPASWQDTSNLLQKLLFLAKDAPLVIDDWAPGQDHAKARELETKAENVIRSQGNRQGRGRMNKDTSTRGNYIPRGLLITSGEQCPSGHSHTARIFTIPLERDQVSKDLLTEAQGNAWMYRYAMAAYIAWLQPNWVDRKLEIRKQFADLRAQVLEDPRSKEIHPRLPDVIAMMYLGLTMGAAFCLEVGAIDQSTHDVMCSDGFNCFMDLAMVQGGKIENERPAKRFLVGLNAAIDAGVAYLDPKNAMAPRTPGPGQTPIGWDDHTNGHVLLHPDLSFQVVVQYFQKTGEPYTIKKDATYADLVRMGFADEGPDNKTTIPTWISCLGKTKRVLKLKKQFLGMNEQEHE